MKRLLLTLAIYSSLVFLMGAGADTDRRYNDLGNKIMCSCSCNQILLQCNHVGCQSSSTMTKELRTAVNNYSNDQDVLDWFRRNYGYTMVTEPKTEGFEGIIWTVPRVLGVMILLLGIYLAYLWSRRPSPALATAGDKGAAPRLDPHMDAFRERARKETEL
jgi:cytochrome c-type biogenesis protein CcmH